MHDDKIERSAGVWTGLSQPVSSGRRPFYCSAVPAAVVQRNIWSGLLSWFLDELQEHNRSIDLSIDMVCFYIAVNTESGACTAPPERRGALQAASLVVQVNIEICAMFTLSGGHMGDRGSGSGLGWRLWFR